MKLSKDTLTILRNFAGINSNLLLKDGNTIGTISAQKNVMANATVAETFPTFAIYDLNEFLGALSLFADPDLTFTDKYVKIEEGGNSIRYYAAAADVLTVPPAKAIVFPTSDIEFKMTATMLAMIQKTASVLRSSDVSITGDGTRMCVVVGDKKNATGNAYTAVVGETDKTFKVNLKVENLKVLPGDYAVSISSKKISRFQSSTDDLMYYIAVESDSSFNG